MDRNWADVISPLINKADFYWQIREVVYLSCDGSLERLREGDSSDFIVPEKFRKEILIKSYR